MDRSDARLTALEGQVAELTKGMQHSVQLGARLGQIEGQVHRVSGALDTFLSRITIDDRLRLVPETRWIQPPSHSPSQPTTPIDGGVVMDDTEGSSLRHSISHGSTSPSEIPDDVRMEEVENSNLDIHRASLIAEPDPTDCIPADLDTVMAGPPPPALNVFPPTPLASHEVSTSQWVVVPSDPPVPHPDPIAGGRAVSRARSRTPLEVLQSSTHLSAEAAHPARTRSRSKTPL